MIKLAVEIDNKTIKITFEQQGVMVIYSDKKKIPAMSEAEILIYSQGRHPVSIDYGKSLDEKRLKAADSLITIDLPWDVEGNLVAQQMLNAWQEHSLKVTGLFEKTKIAKNQFSIVENYQQELFEILTTFGYENQKLKKATKAQHRWNKEVSKIPFYIEHNGAKGEVLWQKRNEMLLKAGAKLKEELPLNKDGSVGFGARLTEKLRADYGDKIAGFVTTDDLIFKSVNEVGLFLYYGGTNGWLVLKDRKGKTIDEYTVVK